MGIEYPYILYIGIPVLLILILFKFKSKQRNFNNEVKVANTKYIKESPYYKKKMSQYKITLFFIKSIYFFAIILSLILISRPVSIDSDEVNKYS